MLGPLATYAEPHTYDLCADHAERLTAPRGWELVRLQERFDEVPDDDDLLAVADALRDRNVREQASRHAEDAEAEAARRSEGEYPPFAGEQRGHLRVLRDAEARGADR